MINKLGALGAKFLVGGDDKTVAFWKELKRAAQTSDPVLITGETGTGKELVAKELHALSPRRGAKLLPCNCADLTATTATSELFGHEKGAFTGADRKAPGLFKSAHEGTIFLDELGELPNEIQAKLLRALQFGEIRPAGASSVDRVDVRIVAATNVPIVRAVAENRFRRDLKERFTIHLELLPLRERAGDIPVLVQHFIRQYAGKAGYNQGVRGVSDSALAKLARRAWPGNIRELENAVRHALARTAESGDAMLGEEAFPDEQAPDQPLDQLVGRVLHEQARLADAIIEEVVAGRRAAASAPEIARQFRPTSLTYQLALRFKQRFPGADGRLHLSRIFGVTTMESINRLLRPDGESDSEGALLQG